MPKNYFPKNLSQNKVLPIRIVSPAFGHINPDAVMTNGFSHRLPYYFFLFVLDGDSQYVVDLETIAVSTHDLLFSLPNQFQEFPSTLHGKDYYKLGFDDECLSRLPRKFPFLLNPLNRQKISFMPDAANRIRNIFSILMDLLCTDDTEPDLILAYLNSLLTEINTAYFISQKRPAGEELEKFIGFKVFVETNLTDQPTISEIAGKLAVSTDSLYRIVKKYSGLSPKEFLTDRLIMEARRRLHYEQNTSVKELAFELGFNDPGYFSRLFKKVTGKKIGMFHQDLS